MRSNWIVPKVLNFDSERNSVKKGKKILGATRTNFEFSEGKLEAGKNNYDFRSATKLQSCEPSP